MLTKYNLDLTELKAFLEKGEMAHSEQLLFSNYDFNSLTMR